MNKAASGRRSEPAPGRARSRTPALQHALDLSNRLLKALTSAHLGFTRGENLQQLFSTLLTTLLELTQSGVGVIAEVLPASHGGGALRVHALVCAPGDAMEPQLPRVRLPVDLPVSELSAPLAAMLVSGEPTRADAVEAASPLLSLLPPVRASLALPCKAGEALVGVVLIAEGPGERGPELVERLRPFTDTCAGLLLGWRAQQRLLRDEELLRAQERELEGHRSQLEALVTQRTESLLSTTVALEERQAQLMHAERMALLGQLVAGIAHEINNPLGYVTSNLATLTQYLSVFLELLGRYRALAEAVAPRLSGAEAELLASIRAYQEEEDLDYLSGDVNDLLHDSREGAHRVADIVRSLKAFVREDSAQQELVDVNRELATTLKVVWNQLKYRSEVRCDYQPVPPVFGRPAQLNQVFTHLLLNAVQALPGQGIIEVSTRHEGDEVLVRICDNGHGMTPEVIAKIFTPFFTTRPPGKGAGLGLSISSDIIARHLGRIEVKSQFAQGSTFTVRLPIARDS